MKTRLLLRSNNFFRSVGIVCSNTLLLLLCHSVLAAEIPTLSPGKEVRITAPKTEKTFLLYVPVDYTNKRPFPIIFCYHGYRGSATTWPFKQVTKGEGFIIVGMNYATDAYYHKLRFTTTAPEKIFFDEALEIISTRVNVDQDYIFMGGYSQGGYSTTVLGEQLLDRLAGNLVLGAGRCYVDMNPPPAELIRGHPFFYGVGELDDPHYPRAKRALQFYTECGADVTFEGWKGEAHKLSSHWMAKTRMREWLITYGPMKQVESGVEEAQLAEKNGRLGEAFTLYTQIAEILPDTELCRTAKESATHLGTQAETQFNRLKKTADEKPYTEIVKALETFRDKYAGSVFKEHATQLLSELLNAKADALEGRAREAEAANNYTRALQLYKLYLTHFREAERYAEVQKHVKALKNKTGMR
jgi:tetratricopeptide (TPR) repeat protein